MLSNLTNKFGAILKQKAPNIGIFLGVLGFGKTIYDTAVKAPKIKEKIAEYKKVTNKTEMSVKDYWKACGTDVIPIALEASLSVVSIFAGAKMHTDRTAALATAYSITSNSFRDYKNKVEDTLTREELEKLRADIAQEKLQNNPPSNEMKVMANDNNEYIFYEKLSGRYFISTWNKIQKAYNELISSALGDVNAVITLNDWLSALGIKNCVHGDIIGWKLYNGKQYWPNIEMTSIVDDNNRPCGSIYYGNEPEAIY